MISRRLVLVGCACLTAVMLWPGEAIAQRRAVPRRGPVVVRPVVRSAVVVSAGFGFGYYRPYFYRPYYSPFYSPFYGSFYSGWYPFYAQYPYPYPGYYRGSWASARLEVKPREAQVYVDGYFVGMVDQFDGVFQRLDLPTGEHEIAIYLPGHRTYRERTLFRPGASYHFKAVLEPLAPGAPAEPVPQPSATPRGGDPYSDPRDRDPRDPYPPPPRDPRRTQPPDRPGDRSPERGDFGTLSVRVQPADAVVVIDGERWDSPEGGSRLIVQLSGGRHRIEVRKDGFKPYASTVEIRPGETQSLNISLPPGGGI